MRRRLKQNAKAGGMGGVNGDLEVGVDGRGEESDELDAADRRGLLGRTRHSEGDG